MALLKFTILSILVAFANSASNDSISGQKHALRASDLLAKFHQNDYKMKFERVELVRYNKQLLSDFKIKTFKYNRTLAVVNATWTFTVDVGYDYNVVLQFYRFASNEYRLFPLRMQLNACEAFKANAAGIQSMETCGNFNGCPFLKNVPMVVCNWYPNPAYLPPFLPNGEYMVEFQGLFRTEDMFLVRVYAVIFRPIV